MTTQTSAQTGPPPRQRLCLRAVSQPHPRLQHRIRRPAFPIHRTSPPLSLFKYPGHQRVPEGVCGWSNGWPIHLPSLPNLRCSGLRVVSKKDNSWRVIHHLSAPPGNSINDYINPAQFSLHYCTTDSAIRIKNALGSWLKRAGEERRPNGRHSPRDDKADPVAQGSRRSQLPGFL